VEAFRAGVWEDSIVQFIGYWSYLFALSIIPPFLFLLFMPLPFATVVELTTLLITIYLVVLPTRIQGMRKLLNSVHSGLTVVTPCTQYSLRCL